MLKEGSDGLSNDAGCHFVVVRHFVLDGTVSINGRRMISWKSNAPLTNCPLGSLSPPADLPPSAVYTGTFDQCDQPIKNTQKVEHCVKSKVLTHARVSALLRSI